MAVQCRASSGHPTMTKRRPDRDTTPTPLHVPEKEPQGNTSDTEEDFLTSPIFLGAAAFGVVGLISMVIALTLWKRSRSYSSYIKTVNRMTDGVTGQRFKAARYPWEQHYEEISADDNSRSHSGSKTRLGTTSLSVVRKQSSPNLSSVAARKNSKEIKTVLSAAISAPHTISTGPDHAVSSSTSTVDCSLYEELPESGERRQGIPPPKPFLDRKSLMITRSQSSPADRRNCVNVTRSDDPGTPLKWSTMCTMNQRYDENEYCEDFQKQNDQPPQSGEQKDAVSINNDCDYGYSRPCFNISDEKQDVDDDKDDTVDTVDVLEDTLNDSTYDHVEYEGGDERTDDDSIGGVHGRVPVNVNHDFGDTKDANENCAKFKKAADSDDDIVMIDNVIYHDPLVEVAGH